ncbi:hypothetical protein D3C87_1567290 [compost metagenome]
MPPCSSPSPALPASIRPVAASPIPTGWPLAALLSRMDKPISTAYGATLAAVAPTRAPTPIPKIRFLYTDFDSPSLMLMALPTGMPSSSCLTSRPMSSAPFAAVSASKILLMKLAPANIALPANRYLSSAALLSATALSTSPKTLTALQLVRISRRVPLPFKLSSVSLPGREPTTSASFSR